MRNFNELELLKEKSEDAGSVGRSIIITIRTKKGSLKVFITKIEIILIIFRLNQTIYKFTGSKKHYILEVFFNTFFLSSCCCIMIFK